MLAAQSGADWPLGVYLAAAILVALAMLGVSYVLGERHRERGHRRALRVRHVADRQRAACASRRAST